MLRSLLRALLLPLVLAAIPSAAQGADALVLHVPSQRMGVGRSSAPWSVERTQGGAPVTSGALVVTIEEKDGLLELSETGVSWASRLTLTIADGQAQSPEFLVRAAHHGAVTVEASAPSYPAATIPLLVSPYFIVDDFEGPELLRAPGNEGQWDLVKSETGRSLGRSSSAARTGTHGLRLKDSVASSAVNDGPFVSVTIEEQRDIYLRSWVRFAKASERGATAIGIISNPSAPMTVSLDLVLELPDRVLAVAGYSAGGYSHVTSDRLDAASWQLLEVELTGGGTAQGARRLYLDGNLIGEELALDFRASGFTRVRLGEPWESDMAFAGTLDFDDVWISAAAPPSRLRLDAGALDVDVCAQVELSLRSSRDELAPAPMALSVQLSVDAGGELFSDASCSAPLAELRISPPEAQTKFFVRPARKGPLLLKAQTATLLTAELQIAVGVPTGVGGAGGSGTGGSGTGGKGTGGKGTGGKGTGGKGTGGKGTGGAAAGGTGAASGAGSGGGSRTPYAGEEAMVSCGCAAARPHDAGLFAVALGLLARQRRRSRK